MHFDGGVSDSAEGYFSYPSQLHFTSPTGTMPTTDRWVVPIEVFAAEI